VIQPIGAPRVLIEVGTVLVKDIYPGPAPSTFEPGFTELNGSLLFSADDGTSGYELWKTDGTEAGTVLVKDIDPGAPASYVTPLAKLNDVLVLGADDGVHGYELWKTDGTGHPNPEGHQFRSHHFRS
jgi:ELWxxDGT repeat protein